MKQEEGNRIRRILVQKWSVLHVSSTCPSRVLHGARQNARGPWSFIFELKLSFFTSDTGAHAARGWPDLIASRIPPGRSWSIAKWQWDRTENHENNKNKYLNNFSASWTSLGCLWEASGGVWEASWRRLWSSWGHLGRLCGQEALKSSQGRPQIPPRTSQKGGKRDRCTSFWCLGTSQNDQKSIKIRYYKK